LSDIPGDATTTSTIAIGGTAPGDLEAAGDHDWYAISLTRSESFTVTLTGITLADPYLRIRDAAGNVLFQNDDSGPGLNAVQSFQAPVSGTYFIDVGAANSDQTGTYQLSVARYQLPSVVTNDIIAQQLAYGFWDGDAHHFAVTQDGTITVDLGGLTSAGQALAISALQTWSSIIGVKFQQVSSDPQIIFDDNEPGAFEYDSWTGTATITAHVNVSSDWLTTYGADIGSYAYQAYIHEIGHALGLGHAGNYNETAIYPYDSSFLNDSWATSVMSYFSPRDDLYFRDLGFTDTFVVTPRAADILAMSMLYGLAPSSNPGNTTYGFGANADLPIFDARRYADVAYTVYDTGGTDTFDFSGFSGPQNIDLRPEQFSGVLGNGGNVSIARGTIIENAIGGSGNDTVRGNSADNILIGGPGDDSIVGMEGDDFLVGGPGDDNLSGTTGYDTVSYADADDPITMVNGNVNYAAPSNVGRDTLFGIEHVIGSRFADHLTGIYAENEWLEGGPGDDFLTGSMGIDRLTGGSGSDTFIDTAANLTSDTITDFARGDRIVITNATLANFSYSISGSTLTFPGGSVTLSDLHFSSTAFSAAPEGGVQIAYSGPPIIMSADLVGL
jgi:serralysin